MLALLIPNCSKIVRRSAALEYLRPPWEGDGLGSCSNAQGIVLGRIELSPGARNCLPDFLRGHGPSQRRNPPCVGQGTGLV
jgi:hypothetical protein